MLLLRREFLLFTHHAALRNLLRRDLSLTTRVECWILRLVEHTFKIKYQKRQNNVIANVLSNHFFDANHKGSISSYLDRRSIDNIFSTADQVEKRTHSV